MSIGSFIKRRLIRLHPMIIAGMVIGAIGFYFSASPTLFPGIHAVPVWKVLFVMLIGFTLIPVPSSLEIRGWGEMHPLNGPAWTLFFEYIGNILYALVLRKLSTKILAILVFLAGCALIQLAVTSPNGDVIGGWSMEPAQFRIGLTRLLYPFLAGLLIARIMKPGYIKHSFLYCTLFILFILAFPRVGGTSALWLNGWFDSLTIIFLFPLIVFMGASGEIKGKTSQAICQFLGNISYPIYIIHYPLIYIFSAWVVDNKVSLVDASLMGLALVSGAIVLAYICFKFYDLPVRKWLSKKIMS
jgi:peptidoglycan/LPS O-acetylase OafA/YrhL